MKHRWNLADVSSCENCGRYSATHLEYKDSGISRDGCKIEDDGSVIDDEDPHENCRYSEYHRKECEKL